VLPAWVALDDVRSETGPCPAKLRLMGLVNNPPLSSSFVLSIDMMNVAASYDEGSLAEVNRGRRRGRLC
jgi:hypothetical protein